MASSSSIAMGCFEALSCSSWSADIWEALLGSFKSALAASERLLASERCALRSWSSRKDNPKARPAETSYYDPLYLETKFQGIEYTQVGCEVQECYLKI